MILFMSTSMIEFFWKIVGGDPFILNRSGKQSKNWFLILGILFCILVILTFSAFFGLFYGVLANILSALIGALILTFILKNLYRLVIISLEPSTLPVIKEHKKKPWAYFIRITIVVLIGAFVAKCIETMLFGHWVDNKVIGDLTQYFGPITISKFEESSYFILHMKELNIHYPFINLLTLMIVSFYVIPIIIKHRLKRRNEYYQIRRAIDKKIVEENYIEFKSLYTRVLQNIYARRREEDKLYLRELFNSKSPKYSYRYLQRYHDEPFNTKPIQKNFSFKTTSEFLDNF